jgi:hypothetical protein
MNEKIPEINEKEDITEAFLGKTFEDINDF